jgi:quercetin dioxygenase-like cupin family protein
MSTIGIPKGLVDSTPAVSILVNLARFYTGRKLPDTGVDSEVVFDCPRMQLMVRTAVRGTAIGHHFHSVSDEIVIVTGGSGEILINGEWKPVRQGDVHVCPRGVVHDTRALSENLQYLSVFTPHLPPGGDLNFLE